MTAQSEMVSYDLLLFLITVFLFDYFIPSPEILKLTNNPNMTNQLKNNYKKLLYGIHHLSI